MFSSQDIVKQFKHLIATDTLRHSYLLFGENADEMKTTLTEVVTLIDAGKMKKVSGPLIDTLIIEPTDASLGIDVVRGVRDFLYERPFRGFRRTAALLRADLLTDEAQNALLKIAEDPPPHGLLFLSVANLENLLPTLTSRFQKIHVTSDVEEKGGGTLQTLARTFLKSDRARRKEIVKVVTEKDPKTELDLTLEFLDALILELHIEPIKNISLLKEALRIKVAISDHSLNKRLQLAFFSNLW